MADMTYRRRYRSVFISDVHLGARACRAEALLAFLDGLECERLYLLGDIVDGWRLQKRWFWPQTHAAVLDKLFALARAGVEVTYVPGNHDAFARGYCGPGPHGVSIVQESAHLAADGRRYLLAHGDAYDPSGEDGRIAGVLKDLTYRALLRTDRAWRAALRRLGRSEASLAAWLKARSGVARKVVLAYEASLAAEAKRRGFDGIVCGHIHSAANREVEGVAYVNCGDWVESCSVAVEAADGRMEVLRWPSTAQACARRQATRSLVPVIGPDLIFPTRGGQTA